MAGITEPIDFMFVFAAPVLYFIHACIAGLFIALLKVFSVTSFCGGNLLAGIISNKAQGVEKTNWPMMLVLGVIQIALYFFVFSFLIKMFNYHPPGREEETSDDTAAVAAPAQGAGVPDDALAMTIITGLGGKDNINTVENCVTRLRVNLVDPSLVDEAMIKKTGPKGIVRKDNDIQIVYGLEVTDVRRAVDQQLEKMKSAQ